MGLEKMLRIGGSAVLAFTLLGFGPRWKQPQEPAYVEGKVVFEEFTECPRFDPMYELWIDTGDHENPTPYFVFGNGEELIQLEQTLETETSEREGTRVRIYGEPMADGVQRVLPEQIRWWF